MVMPRVNQVHPGVNEYKLKSGETRYRVRFQDTSGKRHSKVFTSRAKAKAYADKVRTEVVEGTFDDHSKARGLKFGQWADTYFNMANLRDSTRYQNSHYYKNHILPRWGKVRLSSIDRLTVLAWLGDLQKTDRQDGRGALAPGTVGKIYSIFRKIYLAAVETGILPRSQLPLKTRLSTEKVKPIRFLTLPEVQRLSDAMEPEYRALVWVGCLCGLRISEIAALRVNDVDLAAKTLCIDEIEIYLPGRSIWYGEPKTSRSKRTISLPDFVAQLLDHHMDTYADLNNPHALLFTHKDGPLNVQNWRQRHFTPAAQRAGLMPLTPHDMRHTAASLMILAGCDLTALAEFLGHKDEVMVSRVYGHIHDEHRHKMAANMDAYVQPYLELRTTA